MQKTMYQVYSYRWVNLAVFGLMGFAMGFSIMSPTVLVSSVAEAWSVRFADANLVLIVIGGVLGGALGLPAGRAFDRYGYKLPLLIGATVASVGLLLRGTATSWTMFLIYNAIIALGASVGMGGTGNMIQNWFPPQEIGQANGLSMVLAPLGGAVGTYAVFPLIESAGWSRMWSVLGAVYAAVTVLSWILLREKPDVPPSPRPPRLPKEGDFVHDLKQVMNRTNILLQIVRIAFTGLLSMSPALLPVVFASQDMSPNAIGSVMGIYNLVGVPAMAVIPGWAFRKGIPKLAMVASLFLAAVSFIAIFYVPTSAGAVWLAIVLSLAVGLALGAVGPISMSISMVQPGVNHANVGTLSGVGMAVMGLGRLAIPPVTAALVDSAGVTAGAWVVTIVVLVGGIVTALLIPEFAPQAHAAAG
jgi:MFS family permease